MLFLSPSSSPLTNHGHLVCTPEIIHVLSFQELFHLYNTSCTCPACGGLPTSEIKTCHFDPNKHLLKWYLITVN